MGLCKCPKRSVTNIFCFEHRVNVCEFCLVSSHSRCIVQSYLSWLQDSDYNPVCTLCSTSLLEGGDTVRLLCYHVFHAQCLDNYYSALPDSTAPAGYTCPTCSNEVFPPENQAGPVAETLRNFLQTKPWARAGLGLPVFDLESTFTIIGAEKSDFGGESSNLEDDFASVVSHHPAFKPTYVPSENNDLREKPSGSKDFAIEAEKPRNRDVDENKYARKSVWVWIQNLLRAHNINPTISASSVRLPNRKLARVAICGCLLLVVFLTAAVLMQTLSRGLGVNDEDNLDPLLNPKLNPNIHVQGR